MNRVKTCFFLLLGLLVAASCNQNGDGSVLGDFYLGRAVPNAKIRVILTFPQDKRELYIKFEKAARKGGFSYRFGPERRANQQNLENMPRSFTWLRNSDLERPKEQSITFSWDDYVAQPTVFYFTLFAPFSRKSFSADDWIEFDEWLSIVLPTEFPDATIEIVIHPAEYTHVDDLYSISDKTGMPIPETMMNE